MLHHGQYAAQQFKSNLLRGGNWRITFEFKGGNAYVLDYEDYH
jgi:hypothetical protein